MEGLTAALEGLKRDRRQNAEIRSMQYEFRPTPTGEGLFLHTLFVEFSSPSLSFHMTV